MVQNSEYRTAEQRTAEWWSNHFDIRNSLFDILRFKVAVAEMNPIFIALPLDSGFWLLTPGFWLLCFFVPRLFPLSLKATWPIGHCSCLFGNRLNLLFRSSSLVLLNGHHVVFNGNFHPSVSAIDHRLVHGQTVPGKKKHFLSRPAIGIVLATVKLELTGKNYRLDDKVTRRGWNGAFQPFFNLLLPLRW